MSSTTADQTRSPPSLGSSSSGSSTPRPLLISDTKDLRAVIGCQMLLLHALRKRRRRTLLDRRTYAVQNTMLLRRVQRRQSRIHFLMSILKTAFSAGLGRDLCLNRGTANSNHVSSSADFVDGFDEDEDDVDDTSQEGNDRLLTPGLIGDDVWLNTFRVGKDLYQFLLTELKPFMTMGQAANGGHPPYEQRVAIALWRLGKVWDDPALLRAFGVTGDTVGAIVREFCSAVVKVLMPRFVQVIKNATANLDDITDQFRERAGLPQCAGAPSALHTSQSSHHRMMTLESTPTWKAGTPSLCKPWLVPTGASGISTLAGLAALRWPRSCAAPASGRRARKARFSLCTMRTVPPVGRTHRVLAAGTGYPLRNWIVTPFLNPDERQLRFNRALCEVLSVGELAFRHLEARFPYLLRHNGSGVDLMPSIVAACSTLHNMCEEWGDGIGGGWIAEASRHALPQPHPGADPARDMSRCLEAEAIRTALFATVVK
ncbi:hypothetical protein MTO96_002341 [Rhipicephalus appendiculatus]